MFDLQFRSRFLCAFYMFGSVRFWFGKQNFDWLALFGSGSRVQHCFGRSLVYMFSDPTWKTVYLFCWNLIQRLFLQLYWSTGKWQKVKQCLNKMWWILRLVMAFGMLSNFCQSSQVFSYNVNWLKNNKSQRQKLVYWSIIAKLKFCKLLNFFCL